MLPKPQAILDRDREWEILAERWRTKQPELVFVLGPRRVGKSHLLAPFAAAVNGTYFQATRRTSVEQLADLSRLLGARFSDAALLDGPGFSSWAALLRYVGRKAEDEPFLLVLDEFPYLEEASPGLASVIQAAWDHDLRPGRVRLVLSGSYVSVMRGLDDVDQPLHARRTARIQIQPFPYFDAARFVPDYGPRDRLRTYGAFGGVPGNLSLVDPKASLTENITRHILDPTSRLYDEAEHMLDPFLSDVQVHYSVLSAVARGNTTWHGITKTVGRSSGSLSRPLRWLLDMGVVRREVPVTEPHPARSRRALYRLDDPYLSFWHRFVSPLLRAGLPATLTSERVWHQHVAPHFDDYMGFVFESACRQFLRHAQTLPFQPTRVGRWWSRDGRDEVDAVALAEGHLLVAECKWGSPTADDLATLHRRSQLVAAEAEGPVANVHLVVFAAGEVTDKTILAEADARRIWLVTANEMFADLAGARWLN